MRVVEFLRPIEIKDASAAGDIVGYGATFGNLDMQGDVCAPGCFSKTLAEHKAAGTVPAMLWSHNPSEPIGVWTSMAEDPHGLLVKGALTLDTQRGAEARALAKDGALALSIGYSTRDAEWQDGARLLKDVQLYEISEVAIPANPAAQILSIKSALREADQIRDAVAFERFLKHHGFANSLARRLAAGWSTAVGRHDDDDARELVALLKQSAEQFRTKGHGNA